MALLRARKAVMKPDLLKTGTPPYVAVILNFKLMDVDLADYFHHSDRLMARAQELPGFYGEEAIRLDDRNGLSVSYWRSLEDIQEWREDPDHTEIRNLGIANWYESYDLRIVEIVRSYCLRNRQEGGGSCRLW